MADYLPNKPAHDRDQLIVTYEDAVDHIYDAFKTPPDGAQKTTARNARRAVSEAYRDLPQFHNWSYLRRAGFIRTVAQQADGTVTYDHASRTVTRTGAAAVFPADVRFYGIEIDGDRYDIESRTSDTAIVLPPTSNPGADITTGVSYILYRSQYPLPFDYRKGSKLIHEGWTASAPFFTTPTRIARANAQSLSAFNGEYTIRGSSEYQGRMVFEFAPPYFSSSQRYDFVYEAAPRQIRDFFSGPSYTEGEVTVSGTTVTVSASSATFTDRMVGCVIRFPYPERTNVAPTGLHGGPLLDNPFAEQRVVMSVTDANNLEMDAALDGDYSSATKYSIGDPIDYSLGSMMTAFHLLCEVKFARMQQLFGGNGAASQVRQREELWRSGLRHAIEEDTITPFYDPEERGPYYQFWTVSLQDDG